MAVQQDPLRERVFHLLSHAVSRFDPGRLEAWVELGLTMTQLRALFVLSKEDGASAGALAERLRVTPSTLTRIVDRLARQGFVQRETDEDDRRLVCHCLSPTGARMVEEMERLGRARMNEAMDRLSAQQLERLVLALEDLTAVLDAQEAEDISREES